MNDDENGELMRDVTNNNNSMVNDEWWMIDDEWGCMMSDEWWMIDDGMSEVGAGLMGGGAPGTPAVATIDHQHIFSLSRHRQHRHDA